MPDARRDAFDGDGSCEVDIDALAEAATGIGGWRSPKILNKDDK